MKSERIATAVLCLLMALALGGFGVYLNSDANRFLTLTAPAEERIVTLQAELDDAVHHGDDLTRTLAERETRLAELTKNTDALRQSEEQAQLELSASQAQVARLRTESASRDEQTVELEGQLAALTTEVNAKDATLEAQNAKLKKALLLVRKQQSRMTEQNAQIAKLQAVANAPRPVAPPSPGPSQP